MEEADRLTGSHSFQSGCLLLSREHVDLEGGSKLEDTLRRVQR